MPDGLLNQVSKEQQEAILYNLAIDDGFAQLGGRRFVEALGKKNDENFPWLTWVIFQKNK